MWIAVVESFKITRLIFENLFSRIEITRRNSPDIAIFLLGREEIRHDSVNSNLNLYQTRILLYNEQFISYSLFSIYHIARHLEKQLLSTFFWLRKNLLFPRSTLIETEIVESPVEFPTQTLSLSLRPSYESPTHLVSTCVSGQALNCVHR